MILTIIICTFIFYHLFGIIAFMLDSNTWNNHDVAKCVGAFFGIFVSLFLAGYIGIKTGSHTIEDKTYLYALQDNITTEANLFLGSGTIEGELKYFYYVKDGKGFKSASVLADYITIYEDEEVNPYYLETTSMCNIPWLGLFAACGGGENTKSFHIPKNSIANNYKLDLTN